MSVSLTTIDVSALPPPEVLEPLDFEQTLAATVVDLQTRYPQFSAKLESEPVIKQFEAFSYRDTLLRTRVNSAARAVLPAFAVRSDLDNIVARANVVRLPIAFDSDEVPTAYESDSDLLSRYLAAFAAPSAGSEDAYIYQAATAWPDRYDIRVLNYADGVGLSPGEVAVYLLAKDGGEVSNDTVATVFAALGTKTARPLTDVVTIRKAEVVNWRIEAHLTILKGASPAKVVEARRAAALAFGRSRYHIGGLVTTAGANSTLWDPNVVNVVMADPGSNVAGGPGKAPYLTEVVLTYEVES